ncbi:MAG TPA: DUF4410 domain-containing protein [Thermoanaerobaculia bacterium]|nr:DUF4410 domain-containing protein [Thermoanaerobaculia bacterium]
MKHLSRVCLALLLLAAVAMPAAARKAKGSSTAPGTYTDWKDEIDELEIVETFKLSDYAQVTVEPFDTKDVPLPEEDDNTYQPVKAVLADPTGPFVQGLSGALGGIDVSRDAPGDGKALLVRARVDEMDPGSRAARYWAGFGAGATRTTLIGEVVDTESGKVLLRFTQARRSGVGAGGGNYIELMNRNLLAIGEDVALILDAF